MKNCETIREWMSEHLDGALDEKRQQAILDHVAVCPDCARVFADLQSTVAVLRDMPEVEPPPDLLERVHERLAREPEQVVQFPARRSFFSSRQIQVAAAAALMIAVCIYGFIEFTSPRRAEEQTAPTLASPPQPDAGPVLKQESAKRAEQRPVRASTPAPETRRAVDSVAPKETLEEERALAAPEPAPANAAPARVAAPAAARAKGSIRSREQAITAPVADHARRDGGAGPAGADKAKMAVPAAPPTARSGRWEEKTTATADNLKKADAAPVPKPTPTPYAAKADERKSTGLSDAAAAPGSVGAREQDSLSMSTTGGAGSAVRRKFGGAVSRPAAPPAPEAASAPSGDMVGDGGVAMSQERNRTVSAERGFAPAAAKPQAVPVLREPQAAPVQPVAISIAGRRSAVARIVNDFQKVKDRGVAAKKEAASVARTRPVAVEAEGLAAAPAAVGGEADNERGPPAFTIQIPRSRYAEFLAKLRTAGKIVAQSTPASADAAMDAAPTQPGLHAVDRDTAAADDIITIHIYLTTL